MIYGGLVWVLLVCQAFCQQATHQQAPHVVIGTTSDQQAVPQTRLCRCDELEQCYKEQTTQYNDLSARCRQECGIALIPSDTIDATAQCYQRYEQAKRDHKSNKHRCVENLVSKPCLSDQPHSASQPTTFSVDPSTLIQHRIKRNYKQFYPTQLNLYHQCVKTCRKNQGVVHFNLDGTPVKTATKTPTNAATPVVPNMVQKPGKGYAACATKLNCLLVPVDKNLEKQAKQICKYQTAQVEDFEFNLCTCLETALKQNFQCTTAPVVDTCSSSSGEGIDKGSCK